MAETLHMAVVSDIAANHVETLYRDGSRTLAALTDLMEICQAAVLYDQLAVSPGARKRSWLLRQFDFVYTPDIKVVEEGADPEPSTPPPPGMGEGPILVDASEERGLYSTNVYGELVLAMAFAELFLDDLVMGSLVNLDALPPGTDPGRSFFAKLPLLMMVLQHQRGILPYEDDAARESLDEVFAPLIGRYRQYAHHVLHLQNGWRAGVVSSVLEQPIVGSLVVDCALSGSEPAEGERARLVRHLDQALLGAPGRAHFFEKWRFPPVGMMVLADARSLGEVPDIVQKMRGRFARLRKSISHMESRLGELSRNAEGFSADAERATRDRENLDRELREAYAAFDEEINRRRTWGRRTELVFNALDYTLAVAEGVGIGSIGKLIDLIGLKRMATMQRVRGLLRVASLVRRADSKLVTETAERLLGKPAGLPGQAALLRMAYEHAERYVKHSPGKPPPVTRVEWNGEDGARRQRSDREFWMDLVRNEPLQ